MRGLQLIIRHLQVITVGNTREWIPELLERAKNLKVNNGFAEGADVYEKYSLMVHD